MAKGPTKFQSHPRPVEGEIEERKSNAGWTVFEIPSTPVSLYFSSFAAKLRPKNPEEIHGG